jgi:hypothetical protein
MIRTALFVLGVLIAVLGLWAIQAGVYVRDPHTIFWAVGAPLALALLGTAWLSLPPTGRLALGSVVLALALVEGAAALVNASREPRIETHVAEDYYQEDPTLGWVPRPGIRTPAWKRVNGRTVYEVEYAIDARGRRLTPVAPARSRTRYALFFGDSCTFGEGVGQRETLPYYAAERAPDHAPYNYGFHGYGPQHLLARLESGTLRSEVEGDSGVGVYLFIDSHVNRAIGSLVVYTGWAHHAPHYVLDASGEPVRRGSLTTGRPFTALVQSVLGRSQLLRTFRIELPPRITDDHVDLTARILARAARLLRQQLGGGRFVVVAFPGSTLAGRLGAALDARGVELLDYSRLLDYAQPEHHIAHDWHPTPLTNRRLAQRLVADLGLAADAAP